ncbi:MAG: hypothetical protein ABIG44_17950 [Planctomycetota bacterium]
MAARRKRPVLYEVMRGSHLRDTSERRQTKVAPPTPTPSPAAPPTAAATPDRSPFRFTGGRLYAELGWPALSVVAIGALFILWVTFQAGGRYARNKPPSNDVADTHAGSPLGVVEPGAEDTSASHSAARDERLATPPGAPNETANDPAADSNRFLKEPVAFEFQPGYHYIVIQHFYRTRRDDAVQAANYLRENGVSCIVMPRTRDIELVATTPFLLRQDDANARKTQRDLCNTFKQRIKDIGKEYARENGYAFDQCYERLLLK